MCLGLVYKNFLLNLLHSLFILQLNEEDNEDPEWVVAL